MLFSSSNLPFTPTRPHSVLIAAAAARQTGAPPPRPGQGALATTIANAPHIACRPPAPRTVLRSAAGPPAPRQRHAPSLPQANAAIPPPNERPAPPKPGRRHGGIRRCRLVAG